jgi:SAM-dependent methyltransferase
MTINNADTGEIRRIVQQQYGQRALRVIELTDVTPQFECGSENCGHGNCGNADCAAEAHAHTEAAACCGPADTEHAMALYNEAQIQGLPVEAMAASAGCGNPTALADLRPGETVLDLGSGGGIDCFLAAREVGDTGRVTGLDMTPAMLELARKNQASLGLTNVEFVQGEMESMPLPSDSYDVIISNCVVCLSPDKDAVFSESFRVLSPGGRIHLSDVLALTNEGPSVTDAESWVACAAGAEYHETYMNRLRRAGFERIEINGEGVEFWDKSEKTTYTNTGSFKVTARKPM